MASRSRSHAKSASPIEIDIETIHEEANSNRKSDRQPKRHESTENIVMKDVIDYFENKDGI